MILKGVRKGCVSLYSCRIYSIMKMENIFAIYAMFQNGENYKRLGNFRHSSKFLSVVNDENCADIPPPPPPPPSFLCLLPGRYFAFLLLPTLSFLPLVYFHSMSQLLWIRSKVAQRIPISMLRSNTQESRMYNTKITVMKLIVEDSYGHATF
jgi:hypothetical protein